MTYRGEERRSESNVRDKPAESAIKINNILTALVLGVMSWVGVNIEQMKNEIKDISKISAVNTANIQTLSQRLEHHLQQHENYELNTYRKGVKQ